MSVGFWRGAAAAPERVALLDVNGEAVTAGELLAASNRLGHGLRAAGLEAGDTVLVALENGRAFIEALLAMTQVGLYFLPLNLKLAPPEIAAVVGAAGAKLVLADAGAPIAGTRPADLARGQPSSAPADRKLGEVTFATSGTTGLPRLVKRTLVDLAPDRAAAFGAERRLAAIGGKPADGAVYLAATPLYHSAALAWCAAHLHFGRRVVLRAGWDAEDVLATIAREGVTTTFMVPTHFRRLLALPPEVRAAADHASLRHVVHGGAPCAPELKRRMLDWWGPILTEVYGAAELAFGTSVDARDWLAHPGTVGRGGPNLRVLRVDEGGRPGAPCDPGEVGLVAFEERGELRAVGDRGYVDAEGWLYLCDREGEMIISGGANIYPSEVEAALAAHPEVGDVAVFGVPDEAWGEAVKAVVSPLPATAREAGLRAELEAWCRARIAAYKCPKTIDFAAAIPRSDSGKLLRRVLRDRAAT